MIGLDDFREKMKAEIENTKRMKSVQVSGKNLEDALEQASLELGLPLRVLEYEILDKGKAGIFGIKGSPCRIIAYESVKNKMKREEKSLEEELDLKSYEQDDVPIATDSNGRLSVRLASDGAWAKVFPTVGEGLPIVVEDVVGKLHDRSVLEQDLAIINAVVEQADEMWVKVGEFSYNPANDALCSLDVSEEGMKASITVTEPGPGGADLTVEDIRGFLANNSIAYLMMPCRNSKIFRSLTHRILSLKEHPLYMVLRLKLFTISKLNLTKSTYRNVMTAV